MKKKESYFQKPLIRILTLGFAIVASSLYVLDSKEKPGRSQKQEKSQPKKKPKPAKEPIRQNPKKQTEVSPEQSENFRPIMPSSKAPPFEH
ncbi:MAG: hypothetical protein H7A24_02740 [Leptospiraceae bacterium]|nr:hypothetical protein [Leptospiraceae bacterium]MCP5510767.1 hypothetical protein [Leptospiraceae bacterium]